MKAIFSLLVFAVFMLLTSSVFAAGDIDTLIQHSDMHRGYGGHYALHMGYISMGVLACVGISVIIFHIIHWDFIKECLSETVNGVTRGSAFRLGGYFILMTICLNEVYMTMRKQTFDYQHLVALCATLLILWGFIKADSIISKWGGGSTTPPPAPPQPQVTTTTTTEVK